ncbi:hypothetical protein MFRU_005g01750 [Monilinia fructicola]|nr:hypothetical protein MFRU_005g01750 [Monilinia fructicola]
MSAEIICHPLLGQTTVISADQVDVTVALRPQDVEDTDWEVALWHDSTQDMSWEQLDLAQLHNGIPILTEDARSPAFFFSNTLKRSSIKEGVIHYTIKYRKIGQSAWNWVNDNPSPVGDAEIIFQKPLPLIPLPAIEEYISNLSEYLTVKYQGTHEVSELPIWTLTYSIAATNASATEPSVQRINMGFPMDFTRYFALVKRMNFWLIPRHGKCRFELGEDDCQFYSGNVESRKEEAILLSFLRYDGTHFVMLALSMDGIVTTLTSGKDGSIVMTAKNENEQERKGTVICAVGKSVEDGIAATMDHAKRLVRESLKPGSILDEMNDHQQDVPELKRKKDFHDGLVYCTWNSLGPTLTSTTLFSALDDLTASSIYPSTIMIDDGWQSITSFGSETFPTQHRWSRFEASSTSFPEGLTNLSLRIRKSYPWIKNIGVWHGIFGYWGGIDPESEIGQRYKLRWVEIDNHHRSGMWVVDACDVRRFYDDFYSFLISSGINAIKLDTQGLLADLKNAKDRRELIATYQDAIHKSLAYHFEDRVISCMSQYPSNIFSPQILLSSSNHGPGRIAMRNSDDFWPDEISSHPWHVHANSHTAHLTTHLENIIPDWDMFQTASSSSSYPSYHAAARALSGSLLSLTDAPGYHDTRLLSQLTCPPFQIPRSPTSKTPPRTPPRVLRVNPAKSTHVYSSSSDHRMLILRTSTIDTGIPILGFFNPHPSKSITEIISLEDFPPPPPPSSPPNAAPKSIIRAAPARALSAPARKILLALPPHGHQILTAHPLHPHPLAPPPLDIALLGLTNQAVSTAPITSLRPRLSATRTSLNATLQIKGTGLLAFYVATPRTGPGPGRRPAVSTLRIAGRDLSRFVRGEGSVRTEACGSTGCPSQDGYVISLDLGVVMDLRWRELVDIDVDVDVDLDLDMDMDMDINGRDEMSGEDGGEDVLVEVGIIV